MGDVEASQRLASMRPFEQRAPGADLTYKNNGSREELRAAVLAEVERVRELHRRGELAFSVFEPLWQEFVATARDALKASGLTLADEAEKAQTKDGH